MFGMFVNGMDKLLLNWTEEINMTEKNDWDAWIELQQKGFMIRNVLEQYPEYMHKAVVLALSVAKWHPNNPERGYGLCAVCDYQAEILQLCCDSCLAESICNDDKDDDDLYRQFVFEFYREKRTKIADQIYKILRKKYDKELAKVEKRGKTNGRE